MQDIGSRRARNTRKGSGEKTVATERPKSVKEKSAKARELIKKMQQADGEASPDASTADQGDAAPGQPAIDRQAPNLSEYLSDDEPEAGNNRQPDPQPRQATPQRDDHRGNEPGGDIGSLQAENQRLTQALRVLQGKYDQEVPRQAAMIRELRQQLDELKNGAESAPAGDIEQFREALLDELPESAVDAIVKIATGGLRGSGADQSEIEALRQRLQRVEAQTFEERLDALVPDWRKVDADPRFAEQFLHQHEGNTGRPKGEFYMEAYRAGDVKRCAAFLNEFKRVTGDRGAPPPDAPRGAGDRQRDGGQPRTYRRSDIQRIEAAARRGEYRGKEKELAEVRRQFRLAAATGRVIDDVRS